MRFLATAAILILASLLTGCGKPRCEASSVLHARIGQVRYAVPVALQPLQAAYPASRMVRTEHGYANGRGRYLYCQPSGAPDADLEALMFKAKPSGALQAGEQALPDGVSLISLTAAPNEATPAKTDEVAEPRLFDRPVFVRCPAHGDENQCRLLGTTPEHLSIQFDIDVRSAPRGTWPILFGQVEAFERTLRRPAAE